MTTARQHVLRTLFPLALGVCFILPLAWGGSFWLGFVLMGVFAFGWWVGFEEGA